MPEPRKKLLKGTSEFLKYSSLGIEMGVSIVIGLLIGLWLDRLFGTKPWLTVVFFIFGVAAGFKNVIKLMIDTRDSGDGEDHLGR